MRTAHVHGAQAHAPEHHNAHACNSVHASQRVGGMKLMSGQHGRPHVCARAHACVPLCCTLANVLTKCADASAAVLYRTTIGTVRKGPGRWVDVRCRVMPIIVLYTNPVQVFSGFGAPVWAIRDAE
jgi:hypothetical protein